MSIQIECPNGHSLKIKDKFAGKSGLCPHCRARVQVPNVMTDADVLDLVGDWQPPKTPQQFAYPIDEDGDNASVLDGEPNTKVRKESGMSLLGSAILRHKKGCPHCGQLVELQFVSCPKCHRYFED